MFVHSDDGLFKVQTYEYKSYVMATTMSKSDQRDIMTIDCGAYSAGCVYNLAINLSVKLCLTLFLALRVYSIGVVFYKLLSMGHFCLSCSEEFCGQR